MLLFVHLKIDELLKRHFGYVAFEVPRQSKRGEAVDNGRKVLHVFPSWVKDGAVRLWGHLAVFVQAVEQGILDHLFDLRFPCVAVALGKRNASSPWSGEGEFPIL